MGIYIYTRLLLKVEVAYTCVEYYVHIISTILYTLYKCVHIFFETRYTYFLQPQPQQQKQQQGKHNDCNVSTFPAFSGCFTYRYWTPFDKHL